MESSRESTEDKATDTEDELRAASGRVLRADWRGFSGAWFKDALPCSYPETSQPLFLSQFFSEQTSPGRGFSEATLQSSRPRNNSGFQLSGLRCCRVLFFWSIRRSVLSAPPWASQSAPSSQLPPAKRLPHPSEVVWVAVQGLASSFPSKCSHVTLFCPREPVSEAEREGSVYTERAQEAFPRSHYLYFPSLGGFSVSLHFSFQPALSSQ